MPRRPPAWADAQATPAKSLLPGIPTASAAPSPAETASLTVAIAAYNQAGDKSRTAPLEAFLAAHPNSPYAASLWLEIGLAHEHAGDYQSAITALNRSLTAAGPAGFGTSPAATVADETLANLLILRSGFGNEGELASLLANPRIARDGVLAAPVSNARRALWAMRHTPQSVFLCGVIALEQVLAQTNPNAPGLASLARAQSPAGGPVARRAATHRRQCRHGHARRAPGSRRADSG